MFHFLSTSAEDDDTCRKQKRNRKPGLAVMATAADGVITNVLATRESRQERPYFSAACARNNCSTNFEVLSILYSCFPFSLCRSNAQLFLARL